MFCVTEERARGGQAAKMDEKPSFTCRMYEEKYPEVDEVVMVQVKSIAEILWVPQEPLLFKCLPLYLMETCVALSSKNSLRNLS